MAMHSQMAFLLSSVHKCTDSPVRDCLTTTLLYLYILAISPGSHAGFFVGAEAGLTRRANHLPIFRSHVKPQNKKYFAFPEGQIRGILGHPVLLRRASAVVTDVGRVAMDADVAKT